MHSHLSDKFADASQSDILLCLGSLQYIDEKLAEKIMRLKKKPEHVLINGTPLWEGSQFVTINCIGSSYCAYMIRNRKEFSSEMEAIGYELVDSWKNPNKRCIIPFHDDHSIHSYMGMYFRLAKE